MGKVLLIQMDGKFPNLALMRISSHHKNVGDEVVLKSLGNIPAIEREDLTKYDHVYSSLIFKWNRPVAERLMGLCPSAIIGGSGWDLVANSVDDGLVNIRQREKASSVTRLADFGITTEDKDYSLYPHFTASIGFTQRGCRMACTFCGVPVLEGKISPGESIDSIWRGEGHPKNLILWDNDTFGAPNWRDTFRAIPRWRVSG